MWTATRLLVLLSAVTLASQDHLPSDCVFEGRTVPDGGHVTKADPCHRCHCHGGRLECVWKHCGAPPARCRQLETENGCNKTVYLCPFPDDSSKDDKTASSDRRTTPPGGTTTDADLGPYFPALSSPSSPDGGPLPVRFSLSPPPLPPLSRLSPSQGRESSSDSSEGTDSSAQPIATYFSELTSAPMNFSATLGRGEGTRSLRRLAVGRADLASEARRSGRLHFSAPRPWTAGRSNDRTAERSTERSTLKTTQRTTERPAPRSSFRIIRPSAARPTARSATRTAPRTVPRISAEALARTTPKTTPRTKTWTTPRTKTWTTPRTKPWTTSRTTEHSPSQIPPRSSARAHPRSRLRFPKRPNSLSAERTREGRRSQAQTTTQQPPVGKPDVDLIRITPHPILRPRIRPLSLAESSQLVLTTTRPEKSSVTVNKPRRLAARSGRRPQKTLSISRHRLQRLFPSSGRPEPDIGLREQRSQKQAPATVRQESTTFPSTRRRDRLQPAFQSPFPLNTIPRPRFQPQSSRSRPAPSFPDSRSTLDAENPLSFSPFEREASSGPLEKEASSALLDREPTFPSAPAHAALAAPVVSFDYDLEDDDIDLSEYEFPEFGRRLRREAGYWKARVRGAAHGEDAAGQTAGEETGVIEGWREDRVRRSLLPGDERYGHKHHGHGHHDQQHPHHPDAHDNPDPDRRHGDHHGQQANGRHVTRTHQSDSHHGGDVPPSRNRVGGYYGIGAKKFEGVPHRASRHPERNGAGDQDHRSHQLLDSDQDGPTTCFVSGVRFQLAEVIEAASDSCLECRCAGTAMLCYPKCCFYSTEEARAGQPGHTVHLPV